jgi:3-oxoadipate enol-lactonase
VVDVLDELGFERAHLLGNSWGAMIGGTFAARHPERAGCAVLANGTGSRAPLAYRLRTEASAQANRLPLTRPLVRRGLASAFLGPTSVRTRPWLVDRVAATAMAQDPRSAALAVTSVAARRPDQHALFATIRTPVLVVAGREDRSFPLPELRRMADAIPTAELVVIEDAAHLVSIEVPDRVNALVDDFLARH